MKLMQDMEDGFISALFVKEEDRLSRKLYIQLTIQELCIKHNIKFYTLKNGLINLNNEDEVFRSQLNGALAQMEVAKTTRKVLAAKQSKKEKGHFNGGKAPFGYVKVPGVDAIQIDTEEGSIVKLMFDSIYSKPRADE